MNDRQNFQVAEPGTYRIVEEAARSVGVGDLALSGVTFHGLKDYVRVRKDTILAFNQPADDFGSHLKVNERERTITLVIGEHGGWQKEGQGYNPMTVITATAQFSQDHKTVTGMMTSNFTAENLSKLIRKNRHLFADEPSWRALWMKLRDTQYEISRITESTSNDLGARKKGFDERVINSEPIQFQMKYPVFEGEPKVKLGFEVMYSIVNGDVVLSLLCDNMTLTEREHVKEMMDGTVNNIIQVLGDAIPVIRLN